MNQLRFNVEDTPWQEQPLKMVASVFDGTHQTPIYTEEGVRFVSVEDINNIDESIKFISQQDFKKNFKTKPEVDDILMTRIGDIGSCALVRNTPLAYYVSLALIKCNESVNSEYLKFFIESTFFKKELYRRMIHAAFPKKINLSEIGECLVRIPQKKEQQKIAAFFTALDEKINFNQAKLKKLELIREDLLSKIFDKALKFECSGGWETLPFLELIDSIVDFRGRTPAKLGMDWGDEKNEYLALSALNVKNTGIDESRQDLHYGTKELFEKWMSGKELHKGQVLFTTEAPAGNVTRVPDERPYILSQRVIAFNVNNDYIREDFLQYLLQSRQVQKKILSLASGGTAKGVSQKSLSALKVSIPVSLDEQQKIADFFCGIDLKIELQIKKERLLRSLKQAFMQQMFV